MIPTLSPLELTSFARVAKGIYNVKGAPAALAVAHNNELRGLFSGRHDDANLVNKLSAYQTIAERLTAQYSAFESLEEYEQAFAAEVQKLRSAEARQADLDATGLGEFDADDTALPF